MMRYGQVQLMLLPMAAAAVIALYASFCDAFQLTTSSSSCKGSRLMRKSHSTLNSWSLQVPGNIQPLTWYNEVDYPTARTPVYDDSPYEYRFVGAGNDWPNMMLSDFEDSYSASTSTVSPSEPRVRINPIKRARRWIARRVA